MAQVRVSLEDSVHDRVRVEAARRKLTIAQTVAELVSEGLECQEPSARRREGDREMAKRRRPAVEPVPADGFSVKSTAGVDGFARAARDPAVAEAVADLDKVRKVREDVAALRAMKSPDGPVKSFPKPSKPEKKGRGR